MGKLQTFDNSKFAYFFDHLQKNIGIRDRVRRSFFIYKKKWALVGLWWAYPRDILGTLSAEVVVIFPFR